MLRLQCSCLYVAVATSRLLIRNQALLWASLPGVLLAACGTATAAAAAPFASSASACGVLMSAVSSCCALLNRGLFALLPFALGGSAAWIFVDIASDLLYLLLIHTLKSSLAVEKYLNLSRYWRPHLLAKTVDYSHLQLKQHKVGLLVAIQT